MTHVVARSWEHCLTLLLRPLTFLSEMVLSDTAATGHYFHWWWRVQKAVGGPAISRCTASGVRAGGRRGHLSERYGHVECTCGRSNLVLLVAACYQCRALFCSQAVQRLVYQSVECRYHWAPVAAAAAGLIIDLVRLSPWLWSGCACMDYWYW